MLENADSDTLDQVQQYLEAKSRRTDDEIVVLADIPDHLAGTEIVLTARAPEMQGKPLAFSVKPERAADAQGILDRKIGQLDNRAIYIPAESEAGLVPTTGTVVLERTKNVLRERVAETRRAILDAGASTSEAAKLLGINTGEAVRQRLARKELFGLKLGRDYRFPRWQFDECANSGVVPGIRDVLSVTSLSPLELAAWFETPSSALGQKTPAQVLRDAHDDAERAVVVRAARAAGIS